LEHSYKTNNQANTNFTTEKKQNVEVLGGVRLDSTSSSIKKEWMIVPENSKQEENTEKCIVNNKGLQTHYPSRSNR
jgi:hypothetical protein